MLASRIKVAIILIPVAVLFIIAGGLFYLGAITCMLAVAAWEYTDMFSKGGYSPARWLLIPGVIFLSISRYFWEFNYSDGILAGLILAAMAYHVIRQKEGCQTSAVDFTITIGGLMYIGWLGSYLVSLRFIEDGMWWILLAMSAISIGDAGAYFVGRTFGRHKLAPHVSPNKTVEGYIGGVITTILGGVLLAFLWGLRTPSIRLEHGLVLGVVLGILSPIGDLGESMLKRQFGVKDSGRIFAAHGGMMDRMDTWIWGAVISFYLIIWLW